MKNSGGLKNLPELEQSELRRYARHFSLPEFGIEGQQKLKAAKALVVGAGGLGSPVLLYLAAAGVGTLGLVDFDVVDESNLQRQVLFGVEVLGESKAKSAGKRLLELNPHINIDIHETRLTTENALKIIGDYDLVIDGTDNFQTRYLVNDACVILGKPNVYGSIFRFEGQASVFNFEEAPCYRCLYPEPPSPGTVPSCEEGGVLGVLPGIIGCIQANEAIKIITGIGTTLSGRFLLYDALDLNFQEVSLKRNPECSVCGDHPTVTELIDYEQFCGINQPEPEHKWGELTVTELYQKIKLGNAPCILDIRESYEVLVAKIDGTIHIPMSQVRERLGEIDQSSEIVVLCKTGVRSANICELLVENNFKNVKNLTGGITVWSQVIDSSIPLY
ncbi:MAG: molybdopterin-synthase adenylyltransferase MoeB [Candidatus Marinimicrobia bacterium]|jgi:adenylyltransferase/sulfurtransferase|nr:molybdopterin-synthase adenylyltransferase MoeB [Candidatus Neomarinimicrobiota bacterium]MBT3676051.1 molybdopterin-synthase adenylyltransferase MoeB [Candidatus Neomarinimicrobiota bacterium]MBT3762430.1 molybdopterin-synthase adenylyltransferase MoeB [Candidatus Neomarinimicrobiota bacterium]MBT4067515.1 molybdopterin-synthase adenylyltransferase MoeB [Candidatus Neomarinimicrobiota bacterium]MBT4271678.1 molybdopterin-synthase adenylyltransferase MoeB [Candidatus Neomarinimicrobiota bact